MTTSKGGRPATGWATWWRRASMALALFFWGRAALHFGALVVAALAQPVAAAAPTPAPVETPVEAHEDLFAYAREGTPAEMQHAIGNYIAHRMIDQRGLRP
jgi:hypothetical protein